MLRIYFDDVQEGMWFQTLHDDLKGLKLVPISNADKASLQIQKVLSYDRPDIVLADSDEPILVIERTIELKGVRHVFC